MNKPGVHAITVRIHGVDRIFDSGEPVTIGRAPEVGLTVDSPWVSRIHAELSWQGGWVFADRHSTNGVFIDGRRVVQPVRVDARVQLRLGDPASGPLVVLTPHRSRRERSPAPAHTPTPDVHKTMMASTTQRPPVRHRPSTAPISAPTRIPPAGLSIGRTGENQIVVDDVLASRRHARLVRIREGLGIEDLGSVNGTFVNGARTRRTVLREGDIVTIGKVDLVVAGGTVRYRQRAPAETGLSLHGVGFVVEGSKQLLVDVSMGAGPGSLTAMIGPSGAGKSTLARVIAGSANPSCGAVTFEGRNLHAEYPAVRSRIGLVPQEDVLHRQLTVRQALRYAAELRLPPDTTTADRDRVIAGVLAELALTEHADTRVDRLSGGQRKRASVALELLTGPSLLILDEPTSGLDPALDRQVMAMLRNLADAGRVVVVVTHSVTHLDMCDQVLLLAPGGKTAYCGHPAGVGAALGSSDWAEIFTRVSADPDGVFAAYRAREARGSRRPAPAPPRVGPPGRPAHTSTGRQISTVARRQLRLILADRGYLTFLVVLPFVLGALSLVVPGEAGFGAAGPGAPTEPAQVMVLLILGACFMGSALSVRDLVGERTIYHRERAVGLLPAAYLFAKSIVFGLAALVQSIVLVGIVVAGKGAPGPGAVIPSGSIELLVDIALTACCCVMVGLLLSALARSSDQVMPLLVVTVMAQLVMCGGLIPVTDRAVLDQLSWLFPARWGFAAGASTVDLRAHVATVQPDELWQHTSEIWLLDVAILVVLGTAFGFATLRHLRLKAQR
ncbi:ATP-binding cassette domain-containing protein [Rhodococcus opacus]|uniref:ATP-binding cassette domain-containing protein n=1 Tax=Rhodococcus opacus TaxID=37919 RepID=A0AAX3YQB5_RHOOP|nr:FHA domain-containing protein [Rhodococcus opacus]MCZ4590051.1 ATP-binding cassette domain-containing protein [Rhodococcus opacus]MDV6247937.1 ATP-binding cassette domain-containing protein [Rhodococcus opacus]QZS56046.1 ATP-binding cassette domain-containing protein [Rhodococcus opacus]RKM70882.1 ABC transporter [Rhodococcus opacus]WLF50506.1 ATP-binding cassette domain-containing protein [Rhodococcus opacus]